MYSTLKNYSRQLQRRLSSQSSLDGNSSSNNANGSPGSTKKPLLPETVNDATPSNEASIPAHAYLTLTTAVIALSSVGPTLDLQHGVVPILKVYWRMTGTWMTLLLPAAYSVSKNGWPKLTRQQALIFLSASFCYAVMCVGFVLSLEFTSVGNAVIFSNTHALLLLLGRFLIGSPVSVMEGGGSAVAFLGGVLCTYDEAETVESELTVAPHPVVEQDEVASPIWLSFMGDLIAILSAAGGCTYLVLASTVRARFPSVLTFVFTNMVIASLITLSCILLSGQEIEFSRDIHIGIFGFLNSRFDRLPLEMFMVVVCNLIGSMGYLKSTKYFDNLVISVATLMEPVVASSLAYGMGVGVLPGILGLAGNVLVGIGTIAVINPNALSKKETDTD